MTGMGNKIYVSVVKVRVVKPEPSYLLPESDFYPYGLNVTTSFKVYLSDDIFGDMTVARIAVKEITDNIKEECITLKVDSPSSLAEDSKRFSKELSLRAVGLLSAALPQYEFLVADEGAELEYEIKADVRKVAEIDVVGGRLKVMKAMLVAVFVSSIIPYKSHPWTSYAAGSVFMMFAACVLYCLVAWVVARIVNADKITLSIGTDVCPRICLCRFKTADIYCGPVPVPGLEMPESVVNKYYKCWTIGTIPPVLLFFISYAFVCYRDYLFETSPESITAVLQCPVYSIVALASLSCSLVALAVLLRFLEGEKGAYPQRAFLYSVMQYALLTFSVVEVCQNFDKIVNFIGV